MYKYILIFWVILTTQGCAHSGVNGELIAKQGYSYYLEKDEVVLDSSFAFIFPSGKYELEGTDETYAYFKAPKLGFFLISDKILLSKFKNGGDVSYEDFYNVQVENNNAPWLFKPGCKTGGIKIPLLKFKKNEYKNYFYWCTIEPKYQYSRDGIQGMQSSPIGMGIGSLVRKSVDGKLSTFYSFKMGSPIDLFLREKFPEFSVNDIIP